MLKFLQDYGLPISLSEAGPGIDEIIVLSHWLMLVLFVGWGAFFIISLVKFRASKNPDADYIGVKSHLSSVLEVAVAVIEIVLLIGFAFPIWANRINDVPSSSDGAVHFRVVAQHVRQGESDDDTVISEVDLANGDGMCAGYHGWIDSDFGSSPVVEAEADL